MLRDAREIEEPAGPFDVALSSARQRRSLKWRRYPADVIPMWVAEMDFPLAPPIARVLGEMFERSDFGYPPEPPSAEISRFREAVAGWMERRHGWGFDPELVSITPDTMRVLEIAIRLFTEAGDPVVLADPVYHPFRDVIDDARRVPRWVPMELSRGRWVLDLDALESAFAEEQVRLYLHCNPHNPTGTVHTRAELAAIAELAERHDVMVVSDEVHGDITYGETHVPFATVTPSAAARTITASAATKAFNFAGLRCGFAIAGTENLQRRIRAVPTRFRKLTSLPGYEATIAAYTFGDEWLDALTGHLESMRTRMAERLIAIDPNLVTCVPDGTYLLWSDWRDAELGHDPQRWLVEHARVALSDGAVFGPSGAGYLRLNFATSRAILDEALDRIERALTER